MNSILDVIATFSENKTSVISALRCTGFMSAKLTSDGLCLGSSAAHYLGEDALLASIRVDDGASLCVTSPGITYLRQTESQTTQKTDLDTGRFSSLAYVPRPILLQADCNHREEIILNHTHESKILLSSIYILGRHNEAPGYCTTLSCIKQNGEVKIRQERVFSKEAYPPFRSKKLRVFASIFIYDLTLKPILTKAKAVSDGALCSVLNPYENAFEFVAAGQDMIAIREVLFKALEQNINAEDMHQIRQKLKFSF